MGVGEVREYVFDQIEDVYVMVLACQSPEDAEVKKDRGSELQNKRVERTDSGNWLALSCQFWCQMCLRHVDAKVCCRLRVPKFFSVLFFKN